MKYNSPLNLANLLRVSPKKVIVFDARDDDYQHGHIHGSYNLPYSQLEENPSFPSLDYDAAEVITFHCHFSQNRGPKSAQLFLDQHPQHANKVYVLEGGWKAWKALYFDDTHLTTHLPNTSQNTSE